MALQNPLPRVQESHVLLGLGLQQQTFLIAPGVSDYVTGGYVISSQSCGLKNIQTAWVSGANATAIATWGAQPLFALAQLATSGAGFTGYSQLLFYVYVLNGGAQAASGANLTGAIWELTVQGY